MSLKDIPDLVSISKRYLSSPSDADFKNLSGLVPQTRFIYTCIYTCF